IGATKSTFTATGNLRLAGQYFGDGSQLSGITATVPATINSTETFTAPVTINNGVIISTVVTGGSIGLLVHDLGLVSNSEAMQVTGNSFGGLAFLAVVPT